MRIIHGEWNLIRRMVIVKHRVNTFGTVYQAAFITVFFIIITPLRCFEQPGGHGFAVVAYPDIPCWEGEADHTSMVIGAIFGIVLHLL